VKRRYGYGSTGEVLFDQIFDAAGNPTLQAEQDLLLPLGDHQHSTRVVLAHDFQDATYVRQSRVALDLDPGSRSAGKPRVTA